MASKSLARTAFVCVNCRQKLAASLIPARQSSSVAVQTQPRRLFHRSSRTHSSNENQWTSQTPEHKKDPNGSSGEPVTDLEKLEASFTNEGKSRKPQSTTSFSSANPSVPWYLQEQQSQQQQQQLEQESRPAAANPFLERQRLPDLPSDPPPIIQPLLNHLSVDLGLDYLSLLDLRALDPPAALGGNLLMLFGSARSEKHLNVSADRLCRWLRSEYKLRPQADGLLGRNELKLKLKRKNRRAKLMTAAGAAYTSDPDDGINTGWICVNVGSVENGPEANKRRQTSVEASGFVGFGPSQDPAKIVVQILTENKRNDLDLESLWKDALDTSFRRKAGAQRALEKELASQPAGSDLTDPPKETTASSPGAVNNRQSSDYQARPSFQQQFRHFHSSRSIRSPPEAAAVPNTQPIPTGQVPATKPPDINTPRIDTVAPNTAEPLIQKLDDLLAHSTPSTAAKTLGQHDEDRSSNSFLQSFYADFPLIPEPAHLLAQLHLHCYALKLGNTNFSPTRLLHRLHQLQACGVAIPEQTFQLALEATLLPYHTLPTNSTKPTYPLPKRLQRSMTQMLKNALQVLHLMEANGYSASSPKVLMAFTHAIENPDFDGPSHNPHSPRLVLSPKRHEFYRFLFSRAVEELATSSPDNTSPAIYQHLMTSYLKAHPTRPTTSTAAPEWKKDPDFPSFWNLWHQLARSLVRRTPHMYALMFEAVARKGPAHKVQTELLRRYPEMAREEPPVRCEEPVAGALLLCLNAADVSRYDAPWRAMWEAAERGLLAGRREHAET